MANNIDRNPLILDTAAVLSDSNQFRIRKARLIGAAASDVATLEDGAGRLVLSLKGVVDECDFNHKPLIVTGLELASITAGATLLVYMAD